MTEAYLRPIIPESRLAFHQTPQLRTDVWACSRLSNRTAKRFKYSTKGIFPYGADLATVAYHSGQLEIQSVQYSWVRGDLGCS